MNGTLANALASAGLPGVKLGVSAALPDVAGSAKMNLEWNVAKEFGIKNSFTLSAAPVVDLSCGTLYNGILGGAEVSYSAAKGEMTKQNLALGYNAEDFSVSVCMNEGSLLHITHLRVPMAHGRMVHA